jgi:hypothetical protein
MFAAHKLMFFHHNHVYRKYKLPMSYIIPFPKKADPSSAQDFGQGRQVLAVYPGTTALYRATVASHRKVIFRSFILHNDVTFSSAHLRFDIHMCGCIPCYMASFIRL